MRAMVVSAAGVAGVVLGLTTTASGYWSGVASPRADILMAELAPPDVTVTTVGQDITISVAAPTQGPAPQSYVVTSGPRVVCTLAAPGQCRDDAGQAEAREYTVTAQLGGNWTSTATVTARTDRGSHTERGGHTQRAGPPAVTLGMDPAADTGLPGDAITYLQTPALTLAAPPAAAGYAVDLHLDDAATPFATVTVPATGLATVVTTPTLAEGDHRVTAVPRAGPSTGPETLLGITVVLTPATVSTVVIDTATDPDGVPAAGESITLVTGRPVDPRTICGSWLLADSTTQLLHDVTVTLTGGSTGVTLALASPPGTCGTRVAALGALLTDPGDVPSGDAVVSFVNSTLSLSPDARTLTLVLGTGENDDQGPLPASQAGVFVIDSATLRDHTGLAFDGSPVPVQGYF